jgi:hypothetical protein
MTEMSDLFEPLEFATRHSRRRGQTRHDAASAPGSAEHEPRAKLRVAGDRHQSETAVLRVEGTTAIGWQTQDLDEAGACGNANARAEKIILLIPG